MLALGQVRDPNSPVRQEHLTGAWSQDPSVDLLASLASALESDLGDLLKVCKKFLAHTVHHDPDHARIAANARTDHSVPSGVAVCPQMPPT